MRSLKWIIVVGLYLAMGAVMVANNGWAIAGLLMTALAFPFVVFGLIPYLLDSRPAGSCNEKGYFYSFKYRFGARSPKLY